MKITEEKLVGDQKVIEIVDAQYLGDFTIGIEFNDGTYQKVDFSSFLCNAQHPSIRKYLDESLLRGFEIQHGNLNWNDYDLIFPVWDLYQGKIE